MDSANNQQRNPWWFVPTLYFMQGVPYMIVTAVSSIMYRKMGVGLATIAFWTSLVTWPWTLKMLWGPVVDSISTKRNWVIATQGIMVAGLLLVAFCLHLPHFFTITLTVFFVLAFLSATHDIACDGFYLLALNREQQAFFVGIRSAAWRGAMLFANSVLVVIAGYLETRGKPIAYTWTVALATGALVYGVFYLYGLWALPKPAEDVSGGVREEGESIPFMEAMVSYFKQDKIVAILLFILLYRVGESMVAKIAPLFLIDPRTKGGLGLSTTDLGVINGLVGVVALLIGGLIGGALISKKGLKKCLWPMVICMHTPILFYVWCAYEQPQLAHIYASLPLFHGLVLHITGYWAVCVAVALDNFGYGFGLAAYMVYLMFVSQTTKYKASHYAISTGIMALGAMAAMMVSGILAERLGYERFFVATVLLSIPATIVLFFIPLKHRDVRNNEVETV